MILETIRLLYPDLTRSQRKLADFLAESYREAAFMTASRLAHRLSLNEATVIRFAQRLGYQGFPEMMQDVQALVREELVVPATSERCDMEGLKTHLQTQLAGAQHVVSHISAETGEKAISAILEAQRIYIVGQGSGYAMAQALSLALRCSGLSAECHQGDPVCLAMLGGEVAAGSLVIAVALNASVQVANLLRHARSLGAKTLALASSSVSPCARTADMAIICGQGDMPGMPGLTSFALLIDALSSAVASQVGARANGRTAAICMAGHEIMEDEWPHKVWRSSQ